jgi:two-component system chemotaxis sensor kinase CheA
MAGGVDFREFIAGFLAEADELLRGASTHLIEVDQAARDGQPHPRAVRELFRALHTIKGLAAMVGVEPIADVAHGMESVLRGADRGGGRLSGPAIELLVRGLHAIEERVALLGREQPVPPAPHRLIEALSALQSTGPTGPRASEGLGLPADVESKLGASEREQLAQGIRGGLRAVALEFVPSQEKAARGLNITSVRERLSALGELVKVVPRSLPDTPGGLTFTLLLLTTAEDAVLVQAVEARAAVTELAADAPAPGEATGATPNVESRAVANVGPNTGPNAGPNRAMDAAPDREDAPPAPEDDVQAQSQRFVRVDVSRLDHALEKLSTLVVTRFRIARAVDELTARGADTRALSAIVGDATRQLRDLRESIMHARMISLAEMLQRVPLLVRGLTRNTDKAVALAIRVGDAELDKAVAERLFPVLLHLIRNAVDHAIEPRNERRQQGKPEEGRLAITCESTAGAYLTLTVADDGRGIDRELVARKAGRPVPATDEQLLELIALPGLSTREQASQTSGRGMGMDIVKRTVDALGGSLSLATTPGQGTSFTLRVPLSVTIVDAFSFTTAAQTFVAPVAMVEAIIEVDASRVVRAPAPGGGYSDARLIERRGEPMPLVALDALLALPVRPGQPSRQMPREPALPEPALPKKALIVRRHGEPIAFGVERMLGQQEVVVRPLEDPLVQRTGITGATDLGDGRPTLVLDLVALGTGLSAPARA